MTCTPARSSERAQRAGRGGRRAGDVHRRRRRRAAGGAFDLVSTFDVVHDSVDPVGLMSAIRRALREDGTYLMLEMNASGEVEENRNPLGKFLYNVSTLYCMTTSLAHGGAGIGACMGEEKARELAYAAGFAHFRKLPIEEPVLGSLRTEGIGATERGDPQGRRVDYATKTDNLVRDGESDGNPYWDGDHCSTRGAARAPEQSRARYPDSEGYVERDGSGVFYEVYGEGEHDDGPAADVVARSLPPLEDADPLPRAPLPGAYDGRPRQRPLRSLPRRRGATHPTEFALDSLAVMDATGTERAVSASLSARRAVPVRAGAARARARLGAVVHRASVPLHPVALDALPRTTLAQSARLRRGSLDPRPSGGRRSTPTTGARTTRGSLEWFVAQVLPRAPLDQGDRGRRRVGARHRPRDADRTRAGMAGSSARAAGARAGAEPRLPGAGDPRRPGQDRARTRDGKALARLSDGRRDGDARERRAHAHTGASPSRSTCCCATSCARLRAPRARRVTPASIAPTAPRGRCSSPRRSASATPGATWRSPTSCASCTPTWRSSGSPSTPSRRCWRQRASASTRPARSSPASPRTCSPSPPSTSCTCFEAFRRMDEILAANFMVFHDVVREHALRPVDRRRGVGSRLLPAREPRAEARRRTRG